MNIDGAVLGSHAFVLRFFNSAHGDRLLVVNLGRDIDCAPTPEPLLAPSDSGAWRLVWSSDDPRYGGPGIVHPCSSQGWRFPGENATFFIVDREEQLQDKVNKKDSDPAC